MPPDIDSIVERLASRLHDADVTVAVAESLTGGELSAKLASARGSSTWYRGGIVAYSSDVKHELLDVPPGPVVSEPSACAMAESAARLLDADVTVATTGVGGPDEQDGQPPGTVWLALHDGDSTTATCRKFAGEPSEVVEATIAAALLWLDESLEGRAG